MKKNWNFFYKRVTVYGGDTRYGKVGRRAETWLIVKTRKGQDGESDVWLTLEAVLPFFCSQNLPNKNRHRNWPESLMCFLEVEGMPNTPYIKLITVGRWEFHLPVVLQQYSSTSGTPTFVTCS